MTFLERLGIKRPEQEMILAGVGVEGELREENFPPTAKKAFVVETDSEKFLKLLKKEDPGEIYARFGEADDLQDGYRLYAGIGRDVYVETKIQGSSEGGVATLADIQDMTFKGKPLESLSGWFSLEGEEV